MLKKRSTKLLCLLIAFLWTTVIVGSSYAYFIDSVTMTGNVVASGYLKAGLEYKAKNGEWQDASKGAIFDYQRWEPGYTDVKYIKVHNKGNLAFQYELNVFPAELLTGSANLMDVLEVYYGEGVDGVTRENYATELTYVGTLKDLLTNAHGAAYGVLLPEEGKGSKNVSLPAGVTAPRGSVEACMVLHMDEDAGNEYQNLSVGEGFTVQLAATQYMYENDSFGNTYDQKAELPVLNIPTSMIIEVTPVNGLVPDDVWFNDPANGVSATVPKGAKMAYGATALKLVVEAKKSSEAKVNVTDDEELFAYNVKVEGLASDNTVPVVINMGEVLPNGLNLGNYSLYHVENGNTVQMTLVDSAADLNAHNEFTYDPVTGEVSVAMATFSEVALVADTVNAWNGTVATAFGGGTGTETDPYIIANADQLAYMGDRVSNDNTSYGSKHYKLIADVNIGGVENYNTAGRKVLWYPIGYNKVGGTTTDKGNWYTYGGAFSGTFDGNGHKITGIYQNTWAMVGDYSGTYYNDAMGLFGYVNGGTVKNLTIDNFYSEGEFAPTGCVTAYAAGNAIFENIAITNSHPQTYNTGVAGIVGWDEGDDSNFSFKNITVDSSNTISALWGSWDVAAAGLLGYLSPNSMANLDNCHVSATIDVYNDVCGNYQYYWYRYCGMLIGTVDKTNADGSLNLSNITATNCTVNFGDRHEYYYCEFVENTKASYTHDYQFSRVDNKDIVGSGDNATCQNHNHEEHGYETVNASSVLVEDKQAVYIPFRQLFGGYGWGVDGVDVEEYDDIDVLVVDGSNDKFTSKIADGTTYTMGTTVAIGQLFDEIKNVTPGINAANVQVFVSPVNSTAGGTYIANTDDWTKGTLTFYGKGVATITITDYYYCNPCTITVEVTGSDVLYRVGNGNEAEVKKIVKMLTGKESYFSLEIDGNTTTNTKVQFADTGIVSVKIDGVQYYLEVVDATNVTSLSDPISGNVVLLNDCGLSSLTVSGRNTVYGNGFTATYTGNGQFLNNGLKQGVVTVFENGTLDNLRIKASIYPSAYLYYGSTSLGDYVQGGPSSVEGDKTRYHYQLSAVAASGNATISNCYIYGGRNNIFVNTGDVTIKDTILECGVVANVQIQSNASHTITFENVTTIQYQVNPTIGDTSKVMLGAGVLVGPETTENPTIVLNGDFKQYNWVTSDDANDVSDTKITKAIIQGALDATAYNHTVNGKTASNLGIIYMNEFEAKVENNTGLPYKLGTVSMTMAGNTVKGKVYSLQGATGDQIYSDYANADKSTVNGLYKPQFKYDDDLGGQYVAEGGDEHCYREGDTIHVMFPSGDTKELDLAALVDIQKYIGQDLEQVITCKDENGNAVTVTNGKISLSDAGEYTATYTVTDTLFYDNNGNKVTGSKMYSWDVTVSVSLKDKGTPNAYYKFDSTKQTMGYEYQWSFSGSGNKQYLPFLAGLKIYDYIGQESYLRFDGDNDFNKIASAEITGYTSANHVLIKVTLTDGGVINIDTTARAANGGSTYTGKLQTSGSTLYYVNDGTTSATTTTWVISNYSFVGNNGVTIDSGTVTFSNCENGSVPTGSFSTTIKYTVTYDTNGGNCGQTVGYATSVSAAVTLPTPTRSGYIFEGWYTAASGGTRVGGAGESYTPSANITLYAQWGKPCTVTYNANGGSCDKASEKYTGTALTLPTANNGDKALSGWYTAASGGTRVGGAGETYTPTTDITLYAQWVTGYTVTYNANGGSCNTASQTYTDTALTLPTPTMEGYTFNGWYTAASGGTKIGDAGASYEPEANITLYAQWEINSYTITVKTTNATVKVNGTTVNNNGTVSIQYGAQVTVEVTYSQSNSQSTTIKGTDGTTYTSPFAMPASNVTIEASSSSSSICVTPDTLVTLADGSKKEIQHVTYEDQLLVWDFYKGCYTAATACTIVDHGEDLNTVISLIFEDGTVVKAVNCHAFMDATENEFVYITGDNVVSYIGHEFVKHAAAGYTTVKLVDCKVSDEVSGSFTLVANEHYNFITEDMFSATLRPEDIGAFQYFDIGENMTYVNVEEDIAKYGVFTYEEFADRISRAAFDGFNVQYMKIAIGKGLVTEDAFQNLIDTMAVFTK